MAKDCIFCKIAAKEISTEILWENQDIVAFPDLNPQAPTHLLIIPKRHIPSLGQAALEDGPILAGIQLAATEIANKLGLEEGFRLVTNSGEQAGQTVSHLHYHLLAGREFQWPPG